MTGSPAAAGPRRALRAWSLFDWANSSFPAVVSTFVFATYFTQAVAPSVIEGTAMWGRALTLAGLIIAVLSPIFGAIADETGRRKPWLAAFSALCVGAVALMWYVRPDSSGIRPALILLVLATIGFEIGTVFYNAMLPDLAPGGRLGRWSGWAWGLGYAGGVVCLLLALFGLVKPLDARFPALLGLEGIPAGGVRATNLLVALWFAVFALPLFIWVREAGANARDRRPAAALRAGFNRILVTLRDARGQPNLLRYLLAQMIYTDGLNTLFAFGGIYAAGTFGMDVAEVIGFGIALNVVAGLGAAGFGWVDDRLGARTTITIGLTGLTAFGAALLLIESKTAFWILGLCLSIFFGPVQAASRSLMARLSPPEREAQFFGLYATTGKATAFVGPAVLAWSTEYFQSQRAGMASVLIFFLAGLAMLRRVREPRAA